MTMDRIVLAVAGFMILLSLGLAVFHSLYWLWLTAFVGINLFQSAFTGFCPLVLVLRALKVAPGPAFK